MLGSVLDFIEKGRVLSAVVVGRKGQYCQVITENAREMTLNPKRILNAATDGLDPGIPRHELVRRVKEMSQRREQQKAQVNVTELWELLQGEGESFDAAYLSELAFGDRDPDHVSATFRALFEEKTHFRLNQDRFAISSEEQVARIVEAQERERRREQLLSEGAAWLKSAAAGGPVIPPPDAGEAVELLKGESIWGRDFPRHQDAVELLSRAGLNRLEAAFEVLVALGVWSPDENLDLLRLEASVEFPPAVEAEAAARASAGTVPGLGTRLDLRGSWMATIDGPNTRDYDDALSVERTGRGLRIGVHVADVSACMGPGSQLEH